jgi:tryptophanase
MGCSNSKVKTYSEIAKDPLQVKGLDLNNTKDSSQVKSIDLPLVEPYKIKMIELIKNSTKDERKKWIKEANYNLFNINSDQVFIDLLTDSGTGAMSDQQWGAMMTGDESYDGSKSYYHMKETINEIFGLEYVLPTHQGRGAENVLFSVLVNKGDIIPGNSHFDTTKTHIGLRGGTTIDLTIDQQNDKNNPNYYFKGNIDTNKLEIFLKKTKKKYMS